MTGPAGSVSGETTDDRIIGAALGLIAHEGLGAVTMIKVARTAGVSRQTLYNHYPDVDGIVAEAIRRHNRESIEMLESTLRVVDDAAGKIEQLVRHVVAMGSHAQHAPGIEHGLSADARATLEDYHDALGRCIRDILEEGRRSGVLPVDRMLDVDVVLVRHVLDGLAEASAEMPASAARIAAAGTRAILAAVADP
jgi:AcrR family transcriptional regulator